MSTETESGDDTLVASELRGDDRQEQPAEAAVDLRPPVERRRRNRPSQRRFWLRRTVVLGILATIAGATWLGVSALMARRSLVRAQTATVELRKDLERADAARAVTRLQRITADTRRAKRLTSSPVWKVAGALPTIGRTPRTISGLAAEAHVLSSEVFPRLVTIGGATSGGALRDGDKVNLAALRSMQRGFAAITPVLEGVVSRARALPESSLPTVVADARETLIDDTVELTRTATRLRDATAIAPSMLGADGVRRYFVALQTNAELRGSGGLLGAYGILEADQGRLRLTALGPNKALRDTFPEPTEGLEPSFAARYDTFASDGFWLNSNMSGHFPTVSAIWTSMYERTTGVHIDGSIAVDPLALAEILKATGPATGPGGERISADNIVALTEQQIYARYPHFSQDPLRDQLQLDIARALYDRMIAPISHEAGLMPQLGAAASKGHVRMASNHPAEQAILEGSSVGGALPKSDGPYVQVALNNAGGTKLDYYLKTSMSYAFETAHADSQDVSLILTLRNDAPPTGLPDYVVIRPDLPENAALIRGENRLHVSVYGGRGATLRGAGLDGTALQLDAGTEQGHPVWSAFVSISPGQERTLVIALTERGTDQHVRVVPPSTATAATVEIHGGSAR